ncbi:MAG: DegT/DnrJ/EryC1/StrS family aminotransferase [Elusimicrobiota bacterium]
MVEKLARDGGTPVRQKPVPPRILIGKEEKLAVDALFYKAMLSGGAFDRYGKLTDVDLYEQEYAAFYGVKYATAVSAGTAAVHTAIAALRLEPGDEIITSPITDPGTVMPITLCMCIPVFADLDYATVNMSAESIEKCITEKTKAVIVVHLAGQPCDMDAIMKVAKKHNLVVIEDCAQAHAAKYKGKYVGSIGDMGCYSLMSGKHTTSGGQGGMVITNNEEYYWNAKRFADRGKPFNSTEGTNLFAGVNYRVTELESAVGREQLKKTESIAQKRRGFASALAKKLETTKAFRLWKSTDGAEPNPWFCFVHCDAAVLGAKHEDIAVAVAKEGVSVGAHYVRPIYEQKWMKERLVFGTSKLPWSLPNARKIDYTDSCPVALKTINEHMTMYMHECWTNDDVEITYQAFKKVEEYYLSIKK